MFAVLSARVSVGTFIAAVSSERAAFRRRFSAFATRKAASGSESGSKEVVA
ncbi:hypothetical protein PGT21_000121 [Puccinia graminis f. sp. tritici]|uniref:Uncharacterized protein n=1 Tax=Puccinia graminis f. sp. tritici TaxID=56615 RepID=A0A5B0LJ24_PUCGR|nr:hypothetical protein PGT21_000121 [Puccinia graminis f. sp. tritici]